MALLFGQLFKPELESNLWQFLYFPHPIYLQILSIVCWKLISNSHLCVCFHFQYPNPNSSDKLTSQLLFQPLLTHPPDHSCSDQLKVLQRPQAALGIQPEPSSRFTGLCMAKPLTIHVTPHFLLFSCPLLPLLPSMWQVLFYLRVFPHVAVLSVKMTLSIPEFSGLRPSLTFFDKISHLSFSF